MGAGKPSLAEGEKPESNLQGRHPPKSELGGIKRKWVYVWDAPDFL